MRVRLKGLNSVKTRLSSGEVVTYYYAWKGGPRLPGKPGEPEFIAAYNEAIARKIPAASGTLLSIMIAYQSSSQWESLADRTKADYAKIIMRLEKEFGDFPLSGLADRRSRAVFLAHRDERARTSRRQADYEWTVLARILSWALDRGLTTANPCERGGRIYRGNRADRVWTESDEAAFMASAPQHLHLPIKLALWTGQRQGDLLAMTWTQYDGEVIRLQQSKTGARVVIPVGKPLQEALAREQRRAGHMLLTAQGTRWTPDGFRTSWRKACKAAGISGVTFGDLRGTAVTRLALAECTEAEIATITGHSLRQVRSILDSNYLHRDPELARSAIRKLETRTEIPKRSPK